MSCSCDEKGFVTTTSQSTFNYKSWIGLSMFLLLFASILFLFTSQLMISIVLLFLIVVMFSIFPVIILYIPSAFLSFMIRTPEFLPKSKFFPGHVDFEEPATFSILKEEVNQMLQKTNHGNELRLTRDTYSGMNKYIGIDVQTKGDQTNAWRLLSIKAGETYSSHAKHFPTLTRLLKKYPEISNCVISVLEPGITIPIHVGYYKGFMRYMIPTHVPKNRKQIYLCVNSKKYHWKEGRGVLWDDNYPHKVYNHTDETRVVIYMDVERKLPGFFSDINRFLIYKALESNAVKEEIKSTETQIKL